MNLILRSPFRHTARKRIRLQPATRSAQASTRCVARNIDVTGTTTGRNPGAFGACRIGEIGSTGAAAAITNAGYHATGKRIRELPIKLDKLL